MADDENKERERVFLVLVDGSDEMPVALRYASARVRRTGGQVALLVVHEPEEFQYFAGIEKILRTEREEQTQDLLRGLSKDVQKNSGREALTYVRRGHTFDEIAELVRTEKDIKVLVVASSKNDKKPGTIVGKLSDGSIANLPVVVALVPGSLEDGDISFLA